uniref:Uncharacterized protein n=1 Tax=Haemonchus contortus TaxID=6289 RepID=A0A7I4Y8W6_HAECO
MARIYTSGCFREEPLQGAAYIQKDSA